MAVIEGTLTVAALLAIKAKLVFKPLGVEGEHGEISADNTMILDPRSRIPLAKTFLHELIHAARPIWSEHRVAQEERRLWTIATWQEKARLFKRLGHAVIWTGEGAISDPPKAEEPLPENPK